MKNEKRKKKIFLICDRGLEHTAAREHVDELERDGHEVYWPARDMKQDDPVGLQNYMNELGDIARSDEVHILPVIGSEDSRFRFGMAFAVFFLMNRVKRIVLVNRAEIERVVESENKRGISKSLNKVLLALVDDQNRLETS